MRRSAGKVGLQVVGANDFSSVPCYYDDGRVNPARCEAIRLQRRRLRVSVSALDHVGEDLEESRPVCLGRIGENELAHLAMIACDSRHRRAGREAPSTRCAATLLADQLQERPRVTRSEEQGDLEGSRGHGDGAGARLLLVETANSR